MQTNKAVTGTLAPLSEVVRELAVMGVLLVRKGIITEPTLVREIEQAMRKVLASVNRFTYRIVDRRSGTELGEAAGRTKAEALVKLHAQAGFGNVVAISEDGRTVDFVDDAVPGIPSRARYRRLLGGMEHVRFEQVA